MARFFFRRLQTLFVLFALLFTILGGRMVYIQLLQGPKLSAMGSKIHSQFIPGEAIPRGDILDRNGVSLVDLGEREAAVIFPAVLEEEKIPVLSQILQLSAEKVKDEIIKAKNYYGNNPFIIKTNLTASQVKNIKSNPIQGVYLIPITSRYGPESLATHLIGHLGLIDQVSWEKFKNKNVSLGASNAYRQDDLIGVKGIEAIYEDYLRSTVPSYYLQATTDAQGRPLLGLGFKKVLNQDKTTNRNNVVLTIDKRIQKVLENIMDQHVLKGAAVILDVSSGEILASASRPNFNQNEIDKYLNSNTQTDFLNRALLHYFPGSVFKVLIAAAALEENLVDPDEEFVCKGKFEFDSGVTIPCWNQEGHGILTFEEALAHSCNPVFIEVGLRLEADKIIKYANRFKLNQDLLVGYPLEDYPSINIERNSPAALGNAVLGQKGVKLSPLQVASIYATIANDGIFYEPSLVKHIKNQEKIIMSFPLNQGEQIISQNTAKKIKKMLNLATLSGTATNAWIEKWGSAGKTSTAQTGEQTGTGKEKINVWFAGFAPLDNPKFAAVIMIEDGISGGKDAAPVFRQIMEELFALNI
ncbi:MAG: peptidoglycan D,D-transpeptidase FtsI family protein [Zhaonellaceae bacterium]